MSISIVVPVYNEQDSLVELHRQIAETADDAKLDFELLLIDDGSTDQSWHTIHSLSQRHANVRGVRLRRNFGKAAALAAGFDRARGSVVISMDADLQDDPREIPRLLVELDRGFDVVSGWKEIRNDPWHKVWPSRVFNWLINRLTNVYLHDHNCGLKAYRREVLSEVHLYGEMHRFVPVLAAARGFRVTEISVQHRPRQHGHSKYGWERFIKGFLDLMTVHFLTGYGNRPQHLLGSFGLISFGLGNVGLLILSVWWAVSRLATDATVLHLHQRASFYFCILAVLLGIQLVSMGFLAELITAMLRPDRAPYSVANDTDQSDQASNGRLVKSTLKPRE
ncbi:MAG: glycosyltransferase family 2 protein [Pirellulaceae bacterium]|nr:glycosyltransferase family 2 protein [Pirellulaceae bacterium]